MCLKPHPLPSIPEDTCILAEQLFRPEELLMLMGQEYAQIIQDEQFTELYSNLGQPALSPALLALVSLLQAHEHASDRIAAAMVRWRIDWKYALHLPLNYTGFDPTVLCEFRARIIKHEKQRLVFDRFLEHFQEKGLLKGRKVQRTDSIAIFTAVRELNRLELVMETLRLALEAILKAAPEWFEQHVPEEWIDRYAQRAQAERIVSEKGAKGEAKTQALLIQTGNDGFRLLDALAEETPPANLIEMPSVVLLKKVWSQHYERTVKSEPSNKSMNEPIRLVKLPVEVQLCEEMQAIRQRSRQTNSDNNCKHEGNGSSDSGSSDSGSATQQSATQQSATQQSATQQSATQQSATQEDAGLRLITKDSRKNLGMEEIITTPHDPEARFATKRGKSHTGFKLHVTETATEDGPAIITDIDISKAPAYDGAAIDPIQERLEERNLLPDKHLADSGYVCGATLARSDERGIELVGPIADDTSGATHKGTGFAAKDFEVDFERQIARCPVGQVSRHWEVKERTDQSGNKQVVIRWDKQQCTECPYREQCVGKSYTSRILVVSEHYALLLKRRQEQHTPEFKEQYRRRAGIEATLSHMMNVHDGRRSRYRGMDKTLLYYTTLSVGINLKRVAASQAGNCPKRANNTVLKRHSTQRTVDKQSIFMEKMAA